MKERALEVRRGETMGWGQASPPSLARLALGVRRANREDGGGRIQELSRQWVPGGRPVDATSHEGRWGGLEAESGFIGLGNRIRQGRLRSAHENFRRGRWAQWIGPRRGRQAPDLGKNTNLAPAWGAFERSIGASLP